MYVCVCVWVCGVCVCVWVCEKNKYGFVKTIDLYRGFRRRNVESRRTMQGFDIIGLTSFNTGCIVSRWMHKIIEESE